MEAVELKYIKGYAQKLNDSEGDVSALAKYELHHLQLLIRKWQLEHTLAQLSEDLSQQKLL